MQSQGASKHTAGDRRPPCRSCRSSPPNSFGGLPVSATRKGANVLLQLENFEIPWRAKLNQPTGEVPFDHLLGPSSPRQAIGEQYTMRESTCPRRRALAASTAAVLLLCGGQPVAEALTITTGGGAPSALRMTTVASSSSRGSLSRGARIPGDANIGHFHGNNRWKSAGASSPLFSSGKSFAHRHNALVGAAGSRHHADPSATRLHASSMVRNTRMRFLSLYTALCFHEKEHRG